MEEQVGNLILPLAVRDNNRAKAFVARLWTWCHKEYERRSQPVQVAKNIVLGGLKAALQELQATGGSDTPDILDVRHIVAGFMAAKDIPCPAECQDISLLIKGRGKYSLSTQAPPQHKGVAEEYLERLAERIQEGWKASVSGKTQPKATAAASNPSPNSDSPSVQPTLNIGVIGDVANGKSTLVKAISGKKTQAHSTEQQQHGILLELLARAAASGGRKASLGSRGSVDNFIMFFDHNESFVPFEPTTTARQDEGSYNRERGERGSSIV